MLKEKHITLSWNLGKFFLTRNSARGLQKLWSLMKTIFLSNICAFKGKCFDWQVFFIAEGFWRFFFTKVITDSLLNDDDNSTNNNDSPVINKINRPTFNVILMIRMQVIIKKQNKTKQKEIVNTHISRISTCIQNSFLLCLQPQEPHHWSKSLSCNGLLRW